MTLYGDIELVDIGSNNGLLPGGTRFPSCACFGFQFEFQKVDLTKMIQRRYTNWFWQKYKSFTYTVTKIVGNWMVTNDVQKMVFILGRLSCVGEVIETDPMLIEVPLQYRYILARLSYIGRNSHGSWQIFLNTILASSIIFHSQFGNAEEQELSECQICSRWWHWGHDNPRCLQWRQNWYYGNFHFSGEWIKTELAIHHHHH